MKTFSFTHTACDSLRHINPQTEPAHCSRWTLCFPLRGPAEGVRDLVHGAFERAEEAPEDLGTFHLDLTIEEALPALSGLFKGSPVPQARHENS